MAFKKARLPLKIKNGKEIEIDFVDGYIFEACFSTGKLFDVGIYKNEAKDALHKTNWVVSDVNTGLAICDGRTRKEAVEKFQMVYCSKLERLVMSNEHQEGTFENWYEYTSRIFHEQLEGLK